jgi:hypothetical protein
VVQFQNLDSILLCALPGFSLQPRIRKGRKENLPDKLKIARLAVGQFAELNAKRPRSGGKKGLYQGIGFSRAIASY